jgi:hypothetical protein
LSGLTQGRFVGVTTYGAPAAGTFSVGDYVVDQSGNMYVCTIAGAPGTWANPQSLGNALTVGEETVHRDFMASQASASTTGVFGLTFFTARKTETTTQFRIITGSTAAAATPTLCRVGLYSIASNGDGTLVASIANDTTLFAATVTAYVRSWSVSYAKTAGTRYALGLIVVSGAATPTFIGYIASGTAMPAEWAASARLTGRLTGQSDLPASFTEASLLTSANAHYAAILP